VNWFACPNTLCPRDSWLVQDAPDHYGQWHLSDRFGNGAFLVAAAEPVCPGCGTVLQAVSPAVRVAGSVVNTDPVVNAVLIEEGAAR
jgi:hypothetical protein